MLLPEEILSWCEWSGSGQEELSVVPSEWDITYQGSPSGKSVSTVSACKVGVGESLPLKKCLAICAKFFLTKSELRR